MRRVSAPAWPTHTQTQTHTRFGSTHSHFSPDAFKLTLVVSVTLHACSHTHTHPTRTPFFPSVDYAAQAHQECTHLGSQTPHCTHACTHTHHALHSFPLFAPQPKRIENARILVANTAMDTDKVKIYGARVRTDSMAKVCRTKESEM
jgi:hypothetical protein